MSDEPMIGTAEWFAKHHGGVDHSKTAKRVPRDVAQMVKKVQAEAKAKPAAKKHTAPRPVTVIKAKSISGLASKSKANAPAKTKTTGLKRSAK
jgi:hypothetical protein